MTSYRFEYGTSASSLDSSTPKMSAGSGSLGVDVTATLSGLRAGRSYVYRLVATSDGGSVDGAEETFATLTASRPVVTTGTASGVLTRTATLNGSIDPGGGDTTYYFEYGTTTAYGHRTASADAGSGTSAADVSTTVAGLVPDTAYLFRLVATNSLGTNDGLGEVVKTATSSCVSDVSAITTAEQTVEDQNQAVSTAQSNLSQTQATITTNDTPSAATIAQDKAAVTQAQVTLAADKQALAETTLHAPVSGTVTEVDGAVGDTVGGTGSSVSRGAANSSSSSSASSALGGGTGSGSNASSSSSSTTFATIETLDQLQVVSGFAEADATRLAVGQPVTITFPALTNIEVAGKVVAVASTSTVVSNVVTYDATIALVNPPAEVKDGMTANVSVAVQTKTHVLELSSSAITTNGTASTVELLKNGKTAVTPIRTGLVGDSSTEVMSGLEVGDVVVVPTVSIASTGTSTTGTGALGGGTFGGGAFGGGGLGRGG
jgi:multidrug efflux pump subunit AcrA (membrane-fusion protein)